MKGGQTVIKWIGGIILVFLVIVTTINFFQGRKERPFIWDPPTFYPGGQQPYDLKVLEMQLPSLFPDHSVSRLNRYDFDVYYEEGYLYDTIAYQYELSESVVKHFNYIGIDQYFYITYEDTKALLQHVYQGNDALISTISNSSNLMSELGLEVDIMNKKSGVADGLYRLSMGGQEYEVTAYTSFAYLTHYPDNAKVLATASSGEVVAISIPLGKGKVIYCTLPILFTNYYLLKEDNGISEALLLELQNQDTKWSNYFFGSGYRPPRRSLLGFIHSKPALTWAFYTLLFSLLIFFGFKVKRKERPVEVISSPENVSLKFAESLSKLYMLQGDHGDIIRKKMTYFLEKVRSQYKLDTGTFSEDFLKRLAVKSGVDIGIIREFFTVYAALKNKSTVTDEEFLRFNRLMQNFKKFK